MIGKRFLVLLLTFALSFGGIASAGGITSAGGIASADNGEVDVSHIRFFGEASKLLNDPQEDQEDEIYISSIRLSAKSDYMVVNGKKTSLSTPDKAGASEVLPIVDIAEALGAQADVDNVTGKVTIEDDSRVVVLEPTRSRGASQKQNELQKVAGALTLDFAVEGDEIILTRPFQSRILLVRMQPGKELPDTYGASDCISDGNGNYVLKYGTVFQTKDAYDAINALQDCLYIAPDLEVFLFDTPGSSDVSMFGLPTTSWGTTRIKANLMKDYLAKVGKTDTDIIVAVVDSGVQPDHPHLLPRLVPGRNFTESGSSDPDYISDGVGHGTHVAGTIVDCSTNNVKIMPVKVFTDKGASTSTTQIFNAIVWAVDNGAKIINISSGAVNTSSTQNWDAYYKDSCDYAESKGVTVVAAACNDNLDTKYVSPARLDTVITVAATNKNDQRASFFSIPIGWSNAGDAVDVAAPGVDIPSSWLSSGYSEDSGTSMSAAHISAVVAMLSIYNPSLGPEGIKALLRTISRDLGDSGWDKYFGWGIVDFSLFSGGVTIKGMIRSYNPTNETTIRLLQGNEVISEIVTETKVGSGPVVQSFAFEYVKPGTYTIFISKPAHSPYTLSDIIVKSENIDLTQSTDAAIQTARLPCGDISGDGYINSYDLTILIGLRNYGKHITEENVSKAADLSGSGWINSYSLSILILPGNYNKGPVVIQYAE